MGMFIYSNASGLILLDRGITRRNNQQICLLLFGPLGRAKQRPKSIVALCIYYVCYNKGYTGGKARDTTLFDNSCNCCQLDIDLGPAIEH